MKRVAMLSVPEYSSGWPLNLSANVEVGGCRSSTGFWGGIAARDEGCASEEKGLSGWSAVAFAVENGFALLPLEERLVPPNKAVPRSEAGSSFTARGGAGV